MFRSVWINTVAYLKLQIKACIRKRKLALDTQEAASLTQFQKLIFKIGVLAFILASWKIIRTDSVKLQRQEEYELLERNEGSIQKIVPFAFPAAKVSVTSYIQKML